MFVAVAIKMVPPDALFVVPTAILREPAAPPTAVPVNILIPPLEPPADAPVLRNSAPEVALVELDEPVVMDTAPEVVEESPVPRYTPPPRATAVPDPMNSLPELPLAAVPVLNSSMPDEPAGESAERILTWPDAAVPAAVMEMEPPTAVPVPVVRTTSPPVDDAAVVSPALMDSAPPTPVSVLPTAITMGAEPPPPAPANTDSVPTLPPVLEPV